MFELAPLLKHLPYFIVDKITKSHLSHVLGTFCAKRASSLRGWSHLSSKFIARIVIDDIFFISTKVMDQVCSKGIKEYVVANYKASGRPTLLRLTTLDGNMNPEMSDVDIVPNPEVNDKLASYVS